MQQWIEFGAVNCEKKAWNIDKNKYYYYIYIIHKLVIDIY